MITNEQSEIHYSCYFCYQVVICHAQGSLKFVSNDNVWQMHNDQFATSQAADYQLSFRKDSILISGDYYYEQIIDDPKNPGWKGSNQFFREKNGKVYIRDNGKDEL